MHPNQSDLSQWKADVVAWSEAAVVWAQENITRLQNSEDIGSNPPTPPPPPPGTSYFEE